MLQPQVRVSRTEVEYEEGEPQCYTDEWRRSSPDYVVYLPQRFIGHDSDNVQFLVEVTPKHFLLGKLIPNELLADMTVPKGRGRVHYYGHSPSVGDL